MHDVADELENDPGAQLLDTADRPEPEHNFPGTHSRHVVCAACGWYDPGGQSGQEATGVEALRLEPGGQCKGPAGAKAGKTSLEV